METQKEWCSLTAPENSCIFKRAFTWRRRYGWSGVLSFCQLTALCQASPKPHEGSFSPSPSPWRTWVKALPKARAGGTFGQLFYFYFQMLFPWPVGRAELSINSPWPAPPFLTGDVKRGSTTRTRDHCTSWSKGNGSMRCYWAGCWAELAQAAACPHPLQMSTFIFPPCSSAGFSSGGWIGKNSTLEMCSQEGTVLLDTVRRGISFNLPCEEQAGVRTKDTAHLGHFGGLVPPAVLSTPSGTKLPRTSKGEGLCLSL